MVEQIETEMIKDFIQAFGKLNEEKSNYTNLLYFYTYIFEYVQSNAHMCKILLGHDADSSFIEKFKNAIIQTKPPFDESVPKIKIHFLRPFIISGSIGVVQQWLKDDLNISPKDMAIIIIEMTQNIANTL